MGNVHSGNRWRYGTRSTTEEMRTIDVRRWAREGMLRPGYRGGWKWSVEGREVASIRMRAEPDRVILTYRHRNGGSEWIDKEYPVYIDRTGCRFGGSRAWFICPAVGCRRRVAILYGGTVFACRHCHQLAYESTRESAGDRATRQADRLRMRLGWEPGILNGDGEKPKWMRQRTFDRLVRQHDEYVHRSWVGMAVKLRMTGLLERLGGDFERRPKR